MLRRSREVSQAGRQCIQPRSEPRLTNIERRALVEDFFDRARLIRSLQRLEGNPECFGTGQPSCEGIGCAWREYCLKPEGGTVSYFEVIMKDLRQTDVLRVLDNDGHRVFRNFTLTQLGQSIYHEP